MFNSYEVRASTEQDFCRQERILAIDCKPLRGHVRFPLYGASSQEETREIVERMRDLARWLYNAALTDFIRGRGWTINATDIDRLDLDIARAAQKEAEDRLEAAEKTIFKLRIRLEQATDTIRELAQAASRPR